jgi:hypothetical protein
MGTMAIADVLIEYSDQIKKFILDDNYGCFEILKLKTK